MNIRISKTPRAYQAHHDGRLIAQLTYSLDGDRFVAIETTVQPEARGKGIGGILASALLEDARSERTTVIVHCPFVSAYIDRHPEYGGLRATA